MSRRSEEEHIIEVFMRGNREWVSQMKATDPNFFKETGSGHHPDIMWIGCCDARVCANLIVSQSAGRVFVHRNIANQVHSNDPNCQSALEFAVDVLKVKNIIVCGHHDCGGIRAALMNKSFEPEIENWIGPVRKIRDANNESLEQIPELPAKVSHLAELNVAEQCRKLSMLPSIVKRKANPESNDEPLVHGFVYNPLTGLLVAVNYQ
eukprot:c22098_g1_i1.p1 GENE.c22098_g1_i1~~c22098_g1_i1.p1  ORF type:complete len:216 (+),score=70.72 c22098_g1_i1:30-650(+)